MPTNFWWHSAQTWTVYRSKIPKYGIDPSTPQKALSCYLITKACDLTLEALIINPTWLIRPGFLWYYSVSPTNWAS